MLSLCDGRLTQTTVIRGSGLVFRGCLLRASAVQAGAHAWESRNVSGVNPERHGISRPISVDSPYNRPAKSDTPALQAVLINL